MAHEKAKPLILKGVFMPICLCCSKAFEVPKGDTSDGCCSDVCWEAIYAPGPQEEAILEFDRMEKNS